MAVGADRAGRGVPCRSSRCGWTPGAGSSRRSPTWQGYLRWHVAPDRRLAHEAEIVAGVGAWIGEQVLGPVGRRW